jgi:hypothetical protein
MESSNRRRDTPFATVQFIEDARGRRVADGWIGIRHVADILGRGASQVNEAILADQDLARVRHNPPSQRWIPPRELNDGWLQPVWRIVRQPGESFIHSSGLKRGWARHPP